MLMEIESLKRVFAEGNQIKFGASDFGAYDFGSYDVAAYDIKNAVNAFRWSKGSQLFR